MKRCSLRIITACLTAAVGFALIAASAHASSTIYDGVIEKVEEIPEKRSSKGVLREPADTKIAVRVAHSPYSSVTIHSKIMTNRDGTFQLEHRRLRDFASYFIDEVPVTREQMAAALQPGTRMVTMENRSVLYFLYITPRSQGNVIGLLKAIDGNTLTLERPQIGQSSIGVFERDGGKKEADGQIHLTFEAYPHLEQTVTLDDDAVIIAGGKPMHWQKAKLQPDSGPPHKRASVLVQAKREKMRVELMPESYGDWHTLVNDKPTKGENYELKWQHMGVVTSGIESRKINVNPPKWSEKIKDARGFSSHMLAGNDPGDSADTFRPIYHKGEAPIVDGYYVSNMPVWKGDGMAVPGRIMVNFIRRGRIAPDRFAFSSENPVAWGTVDAIDGDTVSLQAPSIEGVTPSGKQSIQIDEDAEFFHLGLPIERAEAMKQGAILHIYPARPQTVLINAGR